MIKWNEKTSYIISDVDDTIAPVYCDIDEDMAEQLQRLLRKGIRLILISGQSVQNIYRRVISYISPELRQRVFVAHCNGAEIFDFDSNGNIRNKPIYSVLDYTDINKTEWNKVLEEIKEKFNLQYFFINKKSEFVRVSMARKNAVMVEDRKVQVSFDFVNGVGTPDIRTEIVSYAIERFRYHGLKIVPNLGGELAIDFVIEGIDKSNPIRQLFEFNCDSERCFSDKLLFSDCDQVEIWGDSFSASKGDADVDMCKGFPQGVRAICFRDCDDYPKDYNIQIWNGRERLSKGVLEYITNIC